MDCYKEKDVDCGICDCTCVITYDVSQDDVPNLCPFCGATIDDEVETEEEMDDEDK